MPERSRASPRRWQRAGAAVANPAALALALLLGHEARITPEQWEEVGAMAIEPDEEYVERVARLWNRDDLTDEEVAAAVNREADLLKRRQTPPPCPAREAAAREIADLRAQLESLAREMETDDRAGKLAHWIISLRKIADKGER